MTRDDLDALSYASISKIENDRVIMTTQNYKTLLKHAHEDDIRVEDDEKKPESNGRIFVGGGISFNSPIIFGGYLF